MYRLQNYWTFLILIGPLDVSIKPTRPVPPTPVVRALELVDRLFAQPNNFGYKYPDFTFFTRLSCFFSPLRSFPGPPFNTRVNLYDVNLVHRFSVLIYLKAHAFLNSLHVVYCSPHTDFRRPASSALWRGWSTNNRVGNIPFYLSFHLSCV